MEMAERTRTIVVCAVRDGVRASSSIVTVVEVSAGPITTDGDVDDDWKIQR